MEQESRFELVIGQLTSCYAGSIPGRHGNSNFIPLIKLYKAQQYYCLSIMVYVAGYIFILFTQKSYNWFVYACSKNFIQALNTAEYVLFITKKYK